MSNLDNWTIRNENPAHWSLKSGELHMQVQEGNIWGAGSSSVDNIFLHPVANSNYSAETNVELLPNRPFEQAGIGIYWDNDNYIKISKEHFMGNLSLVFVTEKNGNPNVNKQVPFTDARVSLKLQKADGQVTAFYKTEGEEDWQAVMTVEVIQGQEQGVMLYTFSGSRQAPNTAILRDWGINLL